jgi:hypothetical protein
VATCLLHVSSYNGSKCCTNLIYVSHLLRVYYSPMAYYVSSDLGKNFQPLLRLNIATQQTKNQQYRQCTYNATLRSDRVTIVAVEKLYYIL